MKNQTFIATSLLVMVSLTAITGCAPQSGQPVVPPSNHPTSTGNETGTGRAGGQGSVTVTSSSGDANQPGGSGSSNRVPPPVISSDIPYSPLSTKTVTADANQLDKLMRLHPGDGITRGPDNPIYNIGVTIQPSTHSFQAIESVHFTNNLGQPLQKVYFNVWADSIHYQQQGSNQVISDVTVNGKPAAFQLKGTVLTITPSEPVQAGSSATVQMSVSAILPENTDRYGWENTGINLGNWYPILAVHDENGWVTPPYYSQGESFYSLTGAYHLRVKAPKDLVLAVTGKQTSAMTNTDGTVTYAYDAVGVRDAAIVGNTAYKVIQDKILGVTVSTYYTPDQADDAQWMEQSAIRAVQTYTKWYGSYPYDTLRICAMRGWFGGMEYPLLDMISFQPGGNTKATTQLIVNHEVAHQWFYGLVGDDEYLTPMIDESFAEFSQSMLDNQTGTITNVPTFSDKSRPSDPVSNFSDSQANTYFGAVYLDGANMLYDLYNKLGATRFHAMMQAYVQRYKYRVATISDFVTFVSSYAGSDMTSWFASHGVDASDSTQSPLQPWATQGIQTNGVNWHHRS